MIKVGESILPLGGIVVLTQSLILGVIGKFELLPEEGYTRH